MNFFGLTRFAPVVAPPFMFGTRHPLITGLIRFNEEISERAKRILSDRFLKRFPTLPQSTDLVEIVTSEANRNGEHIKSGAGVFSRSSLRARPVQLGIGIGFVGLGDSNTRKSFHEIQVTSYFQHQLTDEWSRMGCEGMLLRAFSADDETVVNFGNTLTFLTDLKRVYLGTHSGTDENVILQKMTHEDKYTIFDAFCAVDSSDRNSSLIPFGLIDRSDNLLCGATWDSDRRILCDPFVTTDCSEEKAIPVLQTLARLIAEQVNEVNLPRSIPLHYSSNDKYIERLLGQRSETLASVFVDREFSTAEDKYLKLPWIFTGLLV